MARAEQKYHGAEVALSIVTRMRPSSAAIRSSSRSPGSGPNSRAARASCPLASNHAARRVPAQRSTRNFTRVRWPHRQDARWPGRRAHRPDKRECPSSLSDSDFRLPGGISPERPGGERQPPMAVGAVPHVATAIISSPWRFGLYAKRTCFSSRLRAKGEQALHVPGHGHKTPFAANLVDSAQQELPEAHHRFDDAEYRLGSLFA
jgi:hypothetical protein